MPSATLKQVAQEAKVSYLTALRAMGSSPGHVRSVTADRVRAAADRLEYRPNAAARALTSQTSPYVGLLYAIGPGCNQRIPAAEMMRAYAEFHFELTAGLEAREYHVLAGRAPHVADAIDERDGAIPKLLQKRHVGGVVVVGDIWPALHREIVRFKIPAVGIYCRPVAQAPVVDLNYRAAAFGCTTHLLQLGHRRIAFIPGRWKTWKTEPMQLGHLAAMGEAGIAPIPCWDEFRESADLVTDLTGSSNRPTAYLVYDDYEAVRVMDRLEATGVRVPADVSIVAVQNLGPGIVRRPTISGCPLPAVAMARRAVDLLLRQLATPGKAVRGELIETSIIAGDSSTFLRKTKGS